MIIQEIVKRIGVQSARQLEFSHDETSGVLQVKVVGVGVILLHEAGDADIEAWRFGEPRCECETIQDIVSALF